MVLCNTLSENEPMIDLRECAEMDIVRIVCTDGEVIVGEITCIDDEEESGLGEIGISVMTQDGRYLGIGLSEIESIGNAQPSFEGDRTSQRSCSPYQA